MPGTSVEYTNYFNTAVDRVLGGINRNLMVAIAHGRDLQSVRFAGGNTEYRQDSDTYKADALAGVSIDPGAKLATKKIRGRDNVTVLVADRVGGGTSARDLQAIADRAAHNLTAILRDAKLQ